MKGRQKETDPFWYPTREDVPPPGNFTPGIIPFLKLALLESHNKGNTRKAALCYDQTVHIAKEQWDRSWGCGYRNFEMACTALMVQPFQPFYFPLLDSPTPPSVRNLQTWIEDAWDRGFDSEGQKELQPLANKDKHIGTSDIWVAFCSRGIPAELVDFNIKTSQKAAIAEWIVKYFSPPRESTHNNTVDDALRGASPVTCTDKMPIILQWKGHSVTVVGYEISKKGSTNLLIFDSSYRIHENVRKLSRPGSSCESQSLGFRDWFCHTSKNDRKRSAAGSPHKQEAPKKRPRPEPINVDEDDDDEVIIISDSRDLEKAPTKTMKHEHVHVEAAHVLTKFRLNADKLKNKGQCQILYFPLEEPLSDEQCLSRKEVTSTQAS